MLRWTEEMTCCKCGKKFKHDFNDAVMPQDVEFRKHPLCKKCQALNQMRNSIEQHNQFMLEHPLISGPLLINPFNIADTAGKIKKKIKNKQKGSK